ncbi:MAG: sigma-E factor regulatory protein RseB domain-containing protein [Gemmatimonadota bacterium]|nr:sigma-E factor regulatory protein RseB domain-containing protein [Gemmatimonadota bacterium]
MKHIPFIILCWLTLSCLFVAPVVRAADLDITYQMIMDAPKQVSYRATMTRQRYNADGDTIFRSTQHIIHQHPDRDRIEVDGQHNTVVIRIKDDIYRRKASGDSLKYSHRHQRGSDVLDIGLGFSSLDLLQTNYHIEHVGSDHVMNRPTLILTFNPQHPGRLTKKAWIDEQTGLVLRTEDRDETGSLTEELYFANLQIDPSLSPDLFDMSEWEGRAVEFRQVIACGSMSEVQKEAGFALAAPVNIPAGFTLEHRRVIQYYGQPMVHFMYTDGLAQLSLFQRVAPPTDEVAWPDGAPERRGDIQMWKLNTYSILRRVKNDKLFTLIGDIPDAESISLLKSLCAIKPSAASIDQASLIGSSSWIVGGSVVGALLLGAWTFRRRRTLI